MSQQGMPQAGPSGTQQGPGNQFQQHMAQIEQSHDAMEGQYQKLRKADGTLKKVREQLVSLAKLGDSVTQEDVIKSAGMLVAHGLGAMEMAGLLADAPEKPEALQAWVQGHLQDLMKREAQLSQVTGVVQHQLGQTALHLLTAHHVGLAQAGVPEAPSGLPPGQVPPAGPQNALGGSNAGP